MHRIIGAVLGAATLALTSIGVAAAASTPVETGCPGGYDLRSVVSLELQDPDYLLPREIDDPDLDAGQFFDPYAGNGNGFVCARELPEGYLVGFEASHPGHIVPVDPLYDFIDDDNPAQGG